MKTQIARNDEAAPVTVPKGYTGPVHLPGTGRMVYWTGKIAIGILHNAPRFPGRQLEQRIKEAA